MNDFYSDIEPEVRAVVKLLRDNGVNTTCSCGHRMYVQFESSEAAEVDRIHRLLMDNGYRNFRIDFELAVQENGWPCFRGTVSLKDWMTRADA